VGRRIKMEVRNADILADRRGSVADSQALTEGRNILKAVRK
jgi:hypothetical protein